MVTAAELTLILDNFLIKFLVIQFAALIAWHLIVRISYRGK